MAVVIIILIIIGKALDQISSWGACIKEQNSLKEQLTEQLTEEAWKHSPTSTKTAEGNGCCEWMHKPCVMGPERTRKERGRDQGSFQEKAAFELGQKEGSWSGVMGGVPGGGHLT